LDQASQAILKLKPVTFCCKEELDSEKIPQFGRTAEAVEKVNPDLWCAMMIRRSLPFATRRSTAAVRIETLAAGLKAQAAEIGTA
jgi:hypothetical protein